MPLSSQQVHMSSLKQVALLLQQVDMSAQQVDMSAQQVDMSAQQVDMSSHSKSNYCYNKSTFRHSNLTSRQSLHHPQFMNSKFKTTMALISLFAPIHIISRPKIKYMLHIHLYLHNLYVTHTFISKYSGWPHPPGLLRTEACR